MLLPKFSSKFASSAREPLEERQIWFLQSGTRALYQIQPIRRFLILPFEVKRIQRIEADDGSGLTLQCIVYYSSWRRPLLFESRRRNCKDEKEKAEMYSNGGVYWHNKGSKDYGRQTIRLSLSTAGHLIFCYDVCRNVNQQANLIPTRKIVV